MKKHILISLTTLLLSSISWCQATITRDNYFIIGDSVLIKHKFDIELTQFTNISSGANVTWDFSLMNFDHPSVITDTISFKDPNGTPFFPVTMEADYSNANISSLLYTDPFSAENKRYSYYQITDEKLEFIGQWADNPGSEVWNDHCTNTIKELQFPFSYLDSFEDNFERFYYDNSFGGNVEINGTVSVRSDGYGTLILPNSQIIYNALRIHTFESGTRTGLEGNVENYEHHSYTWYAPTIRGFILHLDMSLSNPDQIETADFISTSILSTPENNQNSLKIFPNPTEDIINVMTDKNIKSITIYNLSSQRIAFETNVHEMDLSNLEEGIYFLEITDIDNNKARKKVIKK